MPGIQHFVVLMLENRSFDQVFGFRQGVNGLRGNETNLLEPSQPPSPTNPPFQVNNGQPFSITAGEGPSHSLKGVNTQIYGTSAGPAGGAPPANSGFVKSYHQSLIGDKVQNPTADQIEVVMESLAANKLPAINALADAFLVCDNWYCEVPGPTMPNRMYVHAATSAGFAHNAFDHVFDFKTIYNSLQDSGASWAVYDFDANEVLQCSKVNAQKQNFKDFETSFAADVSSGALANYSFILPRFFAKSGPVNSMHGPFDVRPADQLVAEVYGALRANDALWSQCAFILTFDEHGGFYDHVVPPSTGIPNPDGINSPPPGDNASFVPPFGFDRLGLRVPTIIASPLVAAGRDSRRYQHTSILATLKKVFNLSDFLTSRDASAATFEGVFSLPAARTDTPLNLPTAPIIPVATGLLATAAMRPEDQPLDSLQKEMLLGVMRLTDSAQTAETAARSVGTLPTTQGEAADFIRARLRSRFGRRA